jgi:HTH-type transcriptional regulator, transcriptional repressor of NAD biosynthesis genes
MKKGLAFGKFMPLHKGHLALIQFALRNCDHLTIILCYTNKEPISGIIRLEWLKNELENSNNITIVPFEYDDLLLPNTSVSSRNVSKLWAAAFKELVPATDIVFTSEPYGEYIAEYMDIQHRMFDQEKKAVPVSASQLRQKPFKYWEFFPPSVRPWFVKKICLVGTESTGKSSLTVKLASHFNTIYVPEMGREVVEATDNCTYEDLLRIALLHAKKILDKLHRANKLLFVDTDVNITASYSEFLFNKKLKTEEWIEDANQFDLYLFLEPDCEYVQDGTRLSMEMRNNLSEHHKKFFQDKGINFISIGGNWENRFVESCKIIEETFAPLS